MANQNAVRDGNSQPVMLGIDDTTGETRELLCDSLGRLLVSTGTSATGWSTGGNTVGSQQNLGTLDAFALPIITNSTTRFTVSASAATITFNGNTTITNGTGNTLLLSSADTGTIQVDSGTTGNVQIGTSSTGAGKAVIVGSTNGTNSLSLRAGTGNMFIGQTIADTATIGLGGGTQTGTISIGQSSNTQTVTVGAGTGATTVNIGTGGTNGKTVNINNGTATGGITTIGSSTSATTTVLQGSLKYTVTTTSTDLTLTAAHNIVITTSGVTITLPAVDSRREYTIKNTAASSTTVNTTGGVTIDGAVTVTLAQWVGITVVCDGTNWIIKSKIN